jgi:hypothetical protein
VHRRMCGCVCACEVPPKPDQYMCWDIYFFAFSKYFAFPVSSWVKHISFEGMNIECIPLRTERIYWRQFLFIC